MKFCHHKILLIGLSCAVLSACSASGGPGASKKSEYMMQGCIGGGVLGAVIGSTLGGGGDDTAKGAAFGCAVGAVIAFSVAERTEQYASSTQAIDSEIKRNKKNTAELVKYNKGLQENITAYESEINQISNQKLTAKTEARQLKALKSTVSEQAAKAEQALQSVNTELATAKKQRDTYSQSASSNDAKNWEQEIASLETERNILNGHVQTLSAMNSSI